MPKRDLTTAEGDIDSDSLCTPPLIIDPVRELFEGVIDCDPCSNPHSIVGAVKTFTWGGLIRPWGTKQKPSKTYENHPYSINEPWIDKAVYEMRIGNVRELVILCMTATSTKWWQKAMIEPRRNPRVICTCRLKFLGPNGKPLKSGARFDTSLIYYGTKTAKFDRLFKHVARWTTWGR